MVPRPSASRSPRQLPCTARHVRAFALWTATLSLSSASADSGIPSAVYELKESYAPEGFFSKWLFWTDPDPSHGAVSYFSYEDALAAGMVKEEADHAYFGVEKTKKVASNSGRPSVRIQSKATYNSGLFITKINHAPTGCGTWPAFWLYGEDPHHPWPTWGEYDVVEGIHNMNHAMTTLHTSDQCKQDNVHSGRDFLGAWERGTGSWASNNCDVEAPGQFQNQGCSQRTPENSWGQPFNQGGGGTFAAEWDPDAGHIRTWFWPSGSEPGDVVSRLPMPDTWGTPFSYFSLDPESCAASHFKNMRLVFTLNMCGDLGDPYFAASCPVAAKEMTCRELVEQHPEVLHDAYWSIGSLDVYQKPRGALLPFIFFNDAGHTDGGHTAMQSGFLTVLGACSAVMGLAGVALVVRAELSRVHMRDDEESRAAMVVSDASAEAGAATEQASVLIQAGQFMQLMFDGSRLHDHSVPSRTPAHSDDLSHADTAVSSRLRGFSWATSEPGTSAAPSVHQGRDRGISWDSVATSTHPTESTDASRQHEGPGWVL